ncbi:MAG TPA: hypothetical protein PLA71_00555 [Saccharofermentans sp.]|nr:hypothetical protein [Saccharofermentans sp.]
MRFIRWGGLNPVKQKGYDSSGKGTFHSPPARYGIYAFPEKTVEKFLIYKSIFVPERHELCEKFTDGNHVVWKNEKIQKQWEENYLSMTGAEREAYIETNQYYVKMRRPHVFEHNGMLWHHLGGSSIRYHGEWMLSNMEDYIKSYNKERIKEHARKVTHTLGYGRDHFEVFIENIKNK